MATYFPWERGFYVKGGFGRSAVSKAADNGVATSDFGAGGWNVAGGLGYAFWLGQSFNLTANLDFSRQWYRQRIGLECIAVPSPVIAARVVCERREGKFITFINPQPSKGVFLFGEIYRQMSARRPDILFHVIGGRGGTAAALEKAGVDFIGSEREGLGVRLRPRRRGLCGRHLTPWPVRSSSPLPPGRPKIALPR